MPAIREEASITARILVVEDDPIQREVLQSSLSRYGYHVETSFNGLDAVWKIRDGGHDLVLLDYQLPEIDGLGVARLVLELETTATRPPLLALTANPEALHDRLGRSECAFDDIIVKPIAMPALIDKINRHLKADIGRPMRHAARMARLEQEWVGYGTMTEPPADADEVPAAARILVVEDDAMQQAVLRSVLESRGYRVEVAGDGIAAVHAIRTSTFDLVLIDYLLPEMDGLAVGRLILDLMDEDIRPRMLALTASRHHLGNRQVETGSAFDEILDKSSGYPTLLASIDRQLRASPRRSTRRAAQFVAGAAN